MDGFAGHGIINRAVDHLVLLNQGLARKGFRHDGDLIMIAAARQVLHLNLSIRKFRLDHRFDVLGPDHRDKDLLNLLDISLPLYEGLGQNRARATQLKRSWVTIDP